MGAQIDKIAQDTKNPSSDSLINKTLTNLKENFGSFKAICENFFMDITEFEHIFGVSDQSFQIWDTDKNGLIDALELFSGLVVFSNSKSEDKIRFLFEIFDLNEENVIGKIDVEFMIYSVLNSTFKIFEIKEINMIKIEEIQQFVDSTELKNLEEIKVSNLIDFSNNSKEIKKFLTIVKRDNKQDSDQLIMIKKSQQFFCIFFKKNNKKLSFWHDIKLQDQEYFNFITEMPQGTFSKMQMSLKKQFNPIEEDQRTILNQKVKRFYQQSLIFNYGFLPQTIENEKKDFYIDNKIYKGDGDPLDVVELSENIYQIGEQTSVMVLGSLGLIDQGEIDWKILALNKQDFEKNKNIEEQLQKYKYKIDYIKHFFKYSKTYEFKKENYFIENGRIYSQKETLEIIKNSHQDYIEIKNNQLSKFKVLNILIKFNQQNVKR